MTASLFFQSHSFLSFYHSMLYSLCSWEETNIPYQTVLCESYIYSCLACFMVCYKNFCNSFTLS